MLNRSNIWIVPTTAALLFVLVAGCTRRRGSRLCGNIAAQAAGDGIPAEREIQGDYKIFNI